jgi:TonB family protein
MNLADAPNVTFDDRSIAASLKSELARQMHYAVRDPTILVDPTYFPGTADWSPCVGSDPGGVVCGRESAEVLIYPSRPKRLLLSQDQPVASGTWRYRVIEDAQMRPCSVMDGTAQTFTLFIENDSDERLECTASLASGRERFSLNTEPLAVEARERRVAVEACLGGGEVFQSATAACTPRAAPPAPTWNLPAGCAYTVTQAPSIRDYYPSGARRRGEEGAVDLSFIVDAARSRPRDVESAQSSGFAGLDEAAIHYVWAIKARSTCPDVRYLIRVRFHLDDHGQAEETPRSN